MSHYVLLVCVGDSPRSKADLLRVLLYSEDQGPDEADLTADSMEDSLAVLSRPDLPPLTIHYSDKLFFQV